MSAETGGESVPETKLTRNEALRQVASYCFHEGDYLHRAADVLRELGNLLSHRAELEQQLGCRIEEVKL